MLEDSVTSSPSKSNISIPKSRLFRNTKRKQINCEKDKVEPEIFLSNFYNDSEEESSVVSSKISNSTFLIANPTSIVNNYKPFQLEMSFVVADNVIASEDRRPLSISDSQGFCTCQSLAENENNLITITKGKNASFNITESELINCCNQAEKVLGNDSHRKGEGSPTKLLVDDMSLVNSILEDFSQSPLKEGQFAIPTFCQYTPEFRFRRFPIKTYSRKFLNKTRTNLSKQFNNRHSLDLADEHDTCSNCSSLSVQEDVAIAEPFSSPPVSASDTSQCLCENLLNLSVYFTQNDTGIPHFPDTLDNSEKNSPNKTLSLGELLSKNRRSKLIQEILNLRKHYKDFVGSYNSLGDFCGFCNSTDSEEDVAGSEDTSSQTVNNIIDITIRPNGYQNISINCEDNNSLDNCEEILACVNTKEIIRKQNKFEISNENSNSIFKNIQDKSFHVECEKHIDIQNISLNPEKVSKKEHETAVDILKLPDVPAEQNRTNLNNCDTSTLIEDENLFDDPKDYEWNDDWDIFLNFKTPIAFKENPKPELIESNEKALMQLQLKSQMLNENNVPSVSNMCNKGFKTASGKNVSISKKAQESVQQFLNEFNKELTEDLNCNELQEMKNTIYTRKHKQSKQIPVNKTTIESKVENEECRSKVEGETKGFKTANGKNIIVSAKAQESVKNLLSNFFVETKNIDNDLLLIKKQITNRNHELNTLNTQSTNLSSMLKKSELHVLEDERITELSAHAKGTEIQHLNDNEVNGTDINKDRSKPGDSVEEYFCKNNSDFDNVILSEWPLSKHNESLQSSIMKNNSKEKISYKNCDSFGSNLKTNIGFQTANGKQISISSNAQHAVEKLLLEIDIDFNATNIENNIRNMKTDILNKKKTLEKANINMKPLTIQANSNNTNGKLSETSLSVLSQKATENSLTKNPIIINLHNSEKTTGFQTANNKSVSVSAKAQKAVQNLIQEFETELDFETYESNLKALKIKLQNKKEVKRLEKQNCSQEINQYSNIMLSEWSLNESELNKTPLSRNGKRRHSLNNDDITQTNKCSSPPTKIFNNGLRNTDSPFAELSSKSPLNRHDHFVKSGKNLLSLTKRKKSKINSKLNIYEEFPKRTKEMNETVFNTVTPIKTNNSLIDLEKNSTTPNLKEFFTNASYASTPRSKDILCKSPQTISETDFKPINWYNNSNNSNNNETCFNTSQSQLTHSTKISENFSSNITLNSSNPTVKERIGRLKMYGKAPAVSPILIENHNNCRPSGLRRTRSMLKKTENN